MTVPSIERIRALIGDCRRARLTANPGSLSRETATHYATAYGRPTVAVWSHDWLSVVPDHPWDHSAAALEELAEVAADAGAWLVLSYPVVIADPRADPDDNGREVDDGFTLRVWPSLAVREHNNWSPVDP